MKIHCYDPQIARQIHAQFLKKQLVYGEQQTYASLISPSSTHFSPAEVSGINEDLSEFWTLYRVWNQIYQAALVGDAPDWVRAYTESGVAPEDVIAHRIVSAAGLEPEMCRTDYIAISENERKIAEIQWRPGGIGLAAGIIDAYAEVIPYSEQVGTFGNFSDNFYKLITQARRSQAVTKTIVLGTTTEFMNGELYLEQYYKTKGLRYIPILPTRAKNFIVRDNRMFIEEAGETYPIDIMNSEEFTRHLPKVELPNIAQGSVDGKFWIEVPLNYIYRQKWGLALPFMPEYQHLFSDKVRQLVPATVLLNGLNLSPLIPYLDHPQREQLANVKTMDDLASLPTALRKSLIVKCGGGSELHYRSKGVYKLGSAKSYDLKILEFIEQRMQEHQEPWIVQHYVKAKYDVPVAVPWDLDKVDMIEAHARFMIFGGRIDGHAPMVLGGNGNYGRYWKVCGRSVNENQNNEQATGFNDMRVVNS
ncbi:MAG: hypothetical protein PHP00_13225 [Thiotrichaceae bacterium]|nr:hypothetical protein [Thiotrichaceae bacterium]